VRAVGGPVLDLTAVMIVIIGMSLFMARVRDVQANEGPSELDRLDRDAWDEMMRIRGDPDLLDSCGRDGRLSMEKLDLANGESVGGFDHLANKRCEVRCNHDDLSWSFGPQTPDDLDVLEIGIVCSRCPVLLYQNGLVVSGGTLLVWMWR